MKKSLQTILSTLTLSVLSATVHAAYPEQPIKLVVPYAAGGPTDVFARALSEVWGKKLNTTIIVENKAGAGTMLGTEYVAKSANDGYTVLMSTVAHAVNPSLHNNLSFDPIKDFAPIGLAARAPLVLVVNNSLPVKNISEFINYMKKSSDTVDYSSAGVASAPHLGGALINHIGHFKARHIPYRGSAPAMADLIGGHVQFMVDSAPTGLAQAQAGTVRLIATSMKDRLPQTPNTPAIAEVLPGYEAYTWNALLVPAGTDKAIVEKLNTSLAEALGDDDLNKKAFEMGLQLENKPDPVALEEFIKTEIDKWKPVVKTSDMTTN